MPSPRSLSATYTCPPSQDGLVHLKENQGHRLEPIVLPATHRGAQGKINNITADMFMSPSSGF